MEPRRIGRRRTVRRSRVLSLRSFAATSSACFLLLAASAGAATLTVTPDGGTLAPCTAASPCSLTRAVAIADPEPGVVTIDVSAGRIQLPPGGLDAIGANLDGLSIEGSGPATTVITGYPGEISLITLGANGIRFSGLSIEASQVPAAGAAVDVTSGGAQFDHTSFDVEGSPGHFAIHGESNDGVDVEVGDSEVEDSVTTVGAGPFVPGASILVEGNANGGLSVHDSAMLLRDTGTMAGTIRADGTRTLAVDKTVIAMTAPPGLRGEGQGFAVTMDPAIAGYANARVADSIIAGGGGGVWAAANGVGSTGSTLNVDVDRDTIDVGEVGVVDPAPRLDIQLGARDEGSIDMGVRDSVFIDAVKRYDVGGFKCYSPALANIVFAIPITACSNLVFFDDDPASIFPATDFDSLPAGGAGELRSRVIMAFTPIENSVILDDATGAGAPPLDLAGHSRVALGMLDCPRAGGPKMDRGAIERAGIVNAHCPEAPPPVLDHLRLSPRSPRIGKVRRTEVRFHLDRDARVRLVLIGPAHGRRANGHCVAPSKRHGGHKPCWRQAVVAERTYSDTAGVNVHLLGRIAASRPRPGFHRLRAIAHDADSESPAASIRFRIRRPWSPRRRSPCNRGCRRGTGR